MLFTKIAVCPVNGYILIFQIDKLDKKLALSHTIVNIMILSKGLLCKGVVILAI